MEQETMLYNYVTKGENYVIVDVKKFRKINFHALFAVFSYNLL